MHKETIASKSFALSLILIFTCLCAVGCGGGGMNASSPGPTPTPTPASGLVSLSATPSTLGFGTQALNIPVALTVKITNTGTATANITQNNITGSGFSTGITTPISLGPAQNVNVSVVFNPNASGTVSGSLAFLSNGTTMLSVPLSGTGLAPQAHSVDVVWDSSASSTLQGYNVYRSLISGGPYTKISPTLSPTTLLFTDTTPISGQKYFYVVTAVDTSGAESAASLEVAVTIPTP